MRPDSEATLEVWNGIYISGCRNVSHLVLELGVTRGVMRTICSVCAGDWYVTEVRSFRFFFRNFNCFDLV